jgi:hypothetical protein
LFFSSPEKLLKWISYITIIKQRNVRYLLIAVFFKNIFSEIPADDILELFGKTFFEFCQDSGYDKILQVLGATPRDFLQVRIMNKDFNNRNYS